MLDDRADTGGHRAVKVSVGNSSSSSSSSSYSSLVLVVVCSILILGLIGSIVFVWRLPAPYETVRQKAPPLPSSSSSEPLYRATSTAATSPAPALPVQQEVGVMESLSCAVAGSPGMLPVKLSLQVFSMGMCTCLIVIQMVKFYKNRNRTISPQNEDSRMIAQQRINNEKRCIRCCSAFSVLFNKKRLCEKCKFHICKECSAWDADSQTWLCKFCSSREPSPSPEWLQKKLLDRCRQFESAKKIKGNHRSCDEYGRDNENDSGYQQSDSVISWDSSFPKQKSLPDLLEGNPMLDPDILEIHEHVEAMVESLIGDSIENTTLDPMYHNPEYDRMFEIYHGQLQESLLHLIQSLQLSINNQPIDENRTPTAAHSNLKYIIEKIVEEAMALPFLHDRDNTSTPLPSLSPTSNLEEDYDDQSYEDILATAILNKIIEKYQNGKQMNKQFRNETYIYLNNNVQDKSAPRCESICSYVSDKEIQTDFETDTDVVDSHRRTTGSKQIIRPKFIKRRSSDQMDDADEDFSWAIGVRERPVPVQFTIEEKIEEITTTVENPKSGNKHSSHKSTPKEIDEPMIVQTVLNRDSNLPDLTYFGAGFDFSADHKVPFPEFGVDLMPGSREEDDDEEQRETDVTLSDVMDTWENNWLFRQKKFVSPFRNMGSLVIGEEPISMLVPNPQEDVKARVGNRDVDELSEMSEKNSLDFTESYESNSLNEDQEELPQDIDEIMNKTHDEHDILDLEEDTTIFDSSHKIREEQDRLVCDDENLSGKTQEVSEEERREDNQIEPEATLQEIKNSSYHSQESLEDHVESDTSPKVINMNPSDLEIEDEDHEVLTDLSESNIEITALKELQSSENETPVKLIPPTPTPRRSKTPTLLMEDELIDEHRNTIDDRPPEMQLNEHESIGETQPSSADDNSRSFINNVVTALLTVEKENLKNENEEDVQKHTRLTDANKSTNHLPLLNQHNRTDKQGTHVGILFQLRKWQDRSQDSQRLARKVSKHISKQQQDGHNDAEDDIAHIGSANFIPGTIAAKEKQKWLKAVPISNNPYSKENIEKRTQRSSSFTIGSLGGNRYMTLPIERINSGEGDEINAESSLRRTASDKYKRDYYVAQDQSREPYIKRKQFTNQSPSVDIEKSRTGKEQAKLETRESSDSLKNDRLDSQARAKSSRENNSYSAKNNLEAKVVRSTSNSHQHKNEASQVEHLHKHKKHEKVENQNGASKAHSLTSADKILPKLESGDAAKEDTLEAFNKSPIALLGLPSVKNLASRFNGGQQQNGASSNGKNDDVLVRNGATNKPVPQPRTSIRLTKETVTDNSSHTNPNTVITSDRSDSAVINNNLKTASEVSSDCDVNNFDTHSEESIPRRPSVKQLSRRFCKDSGDDSQSASATGAAQVKRVHSLTARSLSREFREAATIVKAPQPPRINITTMGDPNGHSGTHLAAPAHQTHPRHVNGDEHSDNRTATPTNVEKGRGSESDEENSDASKASSASKTRRNISRSIKSRAAFWDRRVAEELLADKLVREEFPPMEMYANVGSNF